MQGIKRQEQEYIALGALDIGMQVRGADRGRGWQERLVYDGCHSVVLQSVADHHTRQVSSRWQPPLFAESRRHFGCLLSHHGQLQMMLAAVQRSSRSHFATTVPSPQNRIFNPLSAPTILRLPVTCRSFSGSLRRVNHVRRLPNIPRCFLPPRRRVLLAPCSVFSASVPAAEGTEGSSRAQGP